MKVRPGEGRYVVGAGMTGLATGLASGYKVLEAQGRPGGICASYEQDGYAFEVGGGHWIFGGDTVVTNLLSGASELQHYRRRSAVLFLGNTAATRELANLVVPYPIQDNLWALPEEIRMAAMAEIERGSASDLPAATMCEWLLQHFGATLFEVFFDPFHARYTAGLHHRIAPQDAFKSPVDINRVRYGVTRENVDGGYNAHFCYPSIGLGGVADFLARRCQVEFGAEVVRIDREARVIGLRDGTELRFEHVVATTPLDRLVQLTGLAGELGESDPHSAVLVLNLGVTLPDNPVARAGYHWVYVPDSQSGFHRIGYYSNVDARFLPERVRGGGTHASLYVETAFPAATTLTAEGRDRVIGSIIDELKRARLIDQVETSDPTWIGTAYTWRSPGSDWVDRAMAACRAGGVEPAGRYGRWHFQGIAASIREGLQLGTSLRLP